MAQRSAVSHARFLLPHLDAASRLLDCGCGPGSISCDFAKIVVSGHVKGIDREPSQIDLARARASDTRAYQCDIFGRLNLRSTFP